MKCLKCGAKLENGVSFCRECGAKVQPEVKKKYCRECGTELKDGAKFCYNCGADINSVPDDSLNTFEEGFDSTSSADTEKTATEEFIYTEPETNNTETSSDSINDDEDTNFKSNEYSYGYEEKASSSIFAKTAKRAKRASNRSTKHTTTKSHVEEKPDASSSNQQKNWITEKWKGMNRFCKVCTVILFIIALMLLSALTTHNGIKIFLYLLEGALVIFAIVVDQDKIKISPKWIKYLALAISVVMVYFTMSQYSNHSNNNNYVSENETTDVPEATKTPEKKVTAPATEKDCIGEKYTEIESKFENAGFTNISVKKAEDLKAAEKDKLETVESISINGNNDFTLSDSFEKTTPVVITYHAYSKCSVNVHVNFVPNIIFNKYDVEFLFDGENIGELPHGEDDDFELSPYPGKYDVEFVSVDSSDVKGSTTLDVDGDVNVSYTISCEKDEIKIATDYEEHIDAVDDDEVMMSCAESDYIGENYEEVEKNLKDLGFNNITTKILYDIVFGITDEGSTESVSINDKTDFKRGDIFKKTDNVVITYHMNEEDDPAAAQSDESESVSYTTNDSATAKKGNSGAYAYALTFSEYSVYYIIDFDDGYVYSFVDNDTSCEKVKIDSGTLNDQVKITYHDGDDEWSYFLKFKEKNNPSTLIEIDEDNNETEFQTTDYKAAVTERDKKNITDYSKSKELVYSTNNADTIKNGNTGAYAYIHSAKEYDIYYIIDFDEGYVYEFNTGDTSCERLQIDSGTLNDKVQITYHDGDTIWSNYLKFSKKNNPKELTLIDQNGFDTKFVPTDYDSAINLKNTMKIHDY